MPGRAAVARRVEAAHEFEAADPKAEADLGCREVRVESVPERPPCAPGVERPERGATGNVDNRAALPESLHPGDGS